MTLFNADDYGVTERQCENILACAREGVLTGVSVMPNSPFLAPAMELLAAEPELHVAVHLNLTEGMCLSDPAEVPLLAGPDGRFYPSFTRLLRLSLGPKRKALDAQLERELSAQIRRVKPFLEGRPLRLDGHQHVQMIPAVLRAVRDITAGEDVAYIRWSAEPLGPYLRHPALWRDIRPVNVVKNLVLNGLALFSQRYMRDMGLPRNMVMGLGISGNLEYRLVSALLPDFEGLTRKGERDLELVMHPGWGVAPGEGLDRPEGPFQAFYSDPGRLREYECLRKLQKETAKP